MNEEKEIFLHFLDIVMEMSTGEDLDEIYYTMEDCLTKEQMVIFDKLVEEAEEKFHND